MVRTSILLSVVAALLLGYILVFERGSLSSRELEQRKGNALVEFVRARVSKLEIQRKGVTTVLVRDLSADPEAVEDLDAGLWQVQAPYRAEADQDAVDTLLGELEWLDGRRRLENISAQDRKRFGFDAPRYRLWFTVGDKRIAVQVGNPSPRGEGVYLSAGDPNVAWVVGKDLIEALDKDPGLFHTKELHDGVLTTTTFALALRDAQGERSVRKRDDGLWNLERGAAGLASAPAIHAVIHAADELRARRFIAQDVKELARYGLDKPRFELEVKKTRLVDKVKDKQGKPQREQVTLRLRVGGACSGHAGESYLTVDEKRTVTCAADEDLAKLQKTVAELRETRLLPVEDELITGVQLERGGGKLVLSQSGKSWTYEVSRAGKVSLKGQAREGAVADWFKALRAAQIARFDVRAPAVAAGDRIAVRFARGKDKPAYELLVDARNPAEPSARRGDEPSGVALAPAALELLQPAAAPFRTLKVFDRGAASLQQLEIRRGAHSERLVQQGAALIMQAPIQAPADNVVADELGRLLSSLEAVRFVADAPAAAHGLSAPTALLVAEYASSGGKPDASPARKRLELRIGAATDGGRFAQLAGEPGVFVVSTQLADLISSPLVSRALLATPLEQLQAVEIEHGSRRLRIEHRDGAFVAAAGSPLSAEAARQLAEAVATLRALRVTAYGPPAAEHGFAQPSARIRVTHAGGRYTIAIGAEADGGRYARRDDQPVTFVLPKQALEKLLSEPTT